MYTYIFINIINDIRYEYNLKKKKDFYYINNITVNYFRNCIDL